MSNGEAHRKLGMIAQRWRALAERRRADFAALYDSGAWTRYYDQDRLLLRMREVVTSADGWALIAAGFEQPAVPQAAPEPTPRAAGRPTPSPRRAA